MMFYFYSVVCIITGGNIDSITLPRCFERAKAVEGRLVKLTVKHLTMFPTKKNFDSIHTNEQYFR